MFGNSKKGLSEQERLQKVQMELRMKDFEKRVEPFRKEFFDLSRKYGCDFGIRWTFNPVQGPYPTIVPVDIQARVDMERKSKAGLA